MFNVLTMCSSKAEMETGLCANVSLFSHAFWWLSVDVASHEICEVYIQSNRQSKFQQEFLSFWLECTNPADCAPNTSCSLRASCTCVCVRVGLLRTNWAESHWKSFTGCVLHPAWGSRLTPKPLACRQVGRAMVFSLAQIRKGISLHFIVPYGDASPLGHTQPLLMNPNCPQGCILHPLTQPSHSQGWDPAHCCSLLCLSHYPALPPNFVSRLLVMVDGPEFLQTPERQKKCLTPTASWRICESLRWLTAFSAALRCWRRDYSV